MQYCLVFTAILFLFAYVYILANKFFIDEHRESVDIKKSQDRWVTTTDYDTTLNQDERWTKNAK